MDYKKVIEDYHNGILKAEDWILVMDNDGGYWRYRGKDPLSDTEEENLFNDMESNYGTPDGYQDLVALANAAGIPCEWC